MNFIKASLREIKHVVWPTKAETKNYFIVVCAILIFYGVYLFIASTIFSESLFFLRDFVQNNIFRY